MKIQEKISFLSLSATVIVMFLIIGYALPLINVFDTVKALGAVAISAGLYKLIATTIYGLLSKWLWLKKILLGAEFLEGTWVGRVRRDPVEYTVEFFRFNNGEITIEGKSFLGDKTPTSHWKSSAFGLDLENKNIFYAYECISENKDSKPEGVAKFNMQWSNTNQKDCDRLEGYSVDVEDGERDFNSEIKLSDEIMSYDQAIDEAIEKLAG
jgi:hypothetical protein